LTVHIVREDVAQTDLFLHEPTIISQLSHLIQPSSKVDDCLVTAAILTDDACLRYRSKVTEVFSSLNANVAHGILMTFFRDLIKRLAADEGEFSTSVHGTSSSV
jgi:E3 ubiquitin-protein ligase HUWE1